MSEYSEVYANPPIDMILNAVPMLQWRTCPDCDYIGLFKNNMLPEAACRRCGVYTENLLSANKLLHRRIT